MNQNSNCQFPTSGGASISRSSRRSIWNLKFGIWSLLFIAVTLLTPRCAQAHGELLIRIAALSSQITTNPEPKLFLDRGELYREDKNWEAAEADYLQAVKLGVPLDSVDFCRARSQADQGRLDVARTILDKIITRSPSRGEALIARADIFARLGARKAALDDFDRGAKCGADLNSDAFLEWAQTLAAENRAADALAVLDRGIPKFGPVNTLQVYAVDLEESRKNLKGAFARLQTIIEQADRKERWLVRLGDLQRAAGMAFEARHSYKQALAAIGHLPKILQRGPSMLNLRNQVNAALAEYTKS